MPLLVAFIDKHALQLALGNDKQLLVPWFEKHANARAGTNNLDKSGAISEGGA